MMFIACNGMLSSLLPIPSVGTFRKHVFQLEREKNSSTFCLVNSENRCRVKVKYIK